MNDRELLELAAKAAGIGPLWYCEGSDVAYYGEIPYHCTFNPLTDDGDALRLAVRLGLWVDTARANDTDYYICVGNDLGFEVNEDRVDNPYSATRRAIVRAAAEIGKGMK